MKTIARNTIETKMTAKHKDRPGLVSSLLCSLGPRTRSLGSSFPATYRIAWLHVYSYFHNF
jgi:hypothetical protein